MPVNLEYVARFVGTGVEVEAGTTTLLRTPVEVVEAVGRILVVRMAVAVGGVC